jgi:hypothetical protein
MPERPTSNGDYAYSRKDAKEQKCIASDELRADGFERLSATDNHQTIFAVGV